MARTDRGQYYLHHFSSTKHLFKGGLLTM